MGVELGIIGRRGSSRLRLALPAMVDLVGGVRRCILADISLTGARVELADAPKPGEFGVLQIGSLEAFGMIVWSGPEGCGFRFDEKISERDLVLLRQAEDQTAEEAKNASIKFARNWVEGG